MAPCSTRLIALTFLVALVGCGVPKPEETARFDPSGGLSGEGGGAAPSGGGGDPLTGAGGSAGAAGGQPGDGQGGLTGASGGTTIPGAGGLSGSGGATGSGGARPPATGGAGGAASSSGGTGSHASGGAGSSASGGVGSTGGVPGGSGGSGSGAGTGSGGAGWVNGTCDAPDVIPTDVSHVDIDVGNLERADTVDLPCAAAAKVVVLSFNLMQTELVYADTFGATWDTVLAFADTCDGTWNTLVAAGTKACSDNACGTSQSQAVALLGYGQHFLFVGGVGGMRGVATIHFQHAQVGSGPLVMLPPGTGTADGTTQGRGAVHLCQASGAENSYWWQSCPSYAGGVMSASTCTGTAFDTVLSLQVPRTGIASCADDDPSCGVQSKMSASIPVGAGIHVLTVDGTAGSDSGNYRLAFTRP